MKKWGLFLLVIIIIATGCQSRSRRSMDDLLNSYSKEMRNEEGLYLIGSIEEKGKKIRGLSLYYFTDQKPSIDNARIILLRSLLILLEKINNDKNLQPYLSSYPFTEKQIDFSILFRTSKGVRPQKPYVAQVSLQDGQIVYDSYNPQTKSLEVIHIESYDVAIEAIEEEMNREGDGASPS